MLRRVATASPASAPEIVQTTHGAVSGVSLPGDITVFRGIRYAQAPIGDLRWKPPVPPPDWNGVHAAAEFGPACIQPLSPPNSIYADNPPQMSEDCLFLNVWKPAHASNAPVMVWIHGGALRGMSGSEGLYNGRQLARKGVIVVTLNYRLGVFGYLALPQLTAESSHHSSGNYGLLDQIAALHWVRDNIDRFGGDRGNITVFGESAGALSTVELMASPLARGLFQQAIMQSGYMVSNMELTRPSYGQPSAEAFGEYIVKKVGTTDLAELRSMDAKMLMDKSYAAGFDPQANIDGWVLPRQIVECFDRGEQARVPVIVGFNAGEIRSLRFFLPPLPKTQAEYVAMVRKIYGDLADKYLELYPGTNIEESALEAARNAFYGWSAVRLARAQTRIGVSAYLYFFDHSYPAEVAEHLEAFHGSELPFEFGDVGLNDKFPNNWPKPPDDTQEKALSQAIMNYFTSFARTGHPVAHGEPIWKPYSENLAYMHFRNKPEPSENLLPGMFALHEEIIARRRAAGTQNWYINVGLASPVVPPVPSPTHSTSDFHK
ncbi:MAG TPA: carboxylesterase family protein [Alloacidobacterium sp.]|nr:carboxylesterase family protein [Alloacidobacterium sp.]